MPNDKPKCEDIGFVHAWEYSSLPGVLNGYGLNESDMSQRHCQNCGKRQHRVFVGAVAGAPGMPLAVRYEWKDAS